MSKKALWIIVGVVAVVLAVVFLKRQGAGYSNLWPGSSPSASVSASPSGKSSGAVATPKVAGTATYSELVAQYAGRRVQFDALCQISPRSPIVFKSGTKIMLDNRSGDPRTVKVGSAVYNLPGYGYQLITLSSQTLPQTLNLSCGSAVNVGQILLQAAIAQ